MSAYDNFRAPQYVDFMDLQHNDRYSDGSSFFDRYAENESLVEGNGSQSINETSSDLDKTLTPFNSSTPRNGVQIRIIPSTPVSTPFKSPNVGASTSKVNSGNESTSVRSRCSGITNSSRRRSRSAGSSKPTFTSPDDILNDAIKTLSLSSRRQSPVEMCRSRSAVQNIVPSAVHPICESKQGSKVIVKGPKRKLSPLPKDSKDYGRQPEKYISMAEQVARIQKQTPPRFRAYQASANLRRVVQSKVSKNSCSSREVRSGSPSHVNVAVLKESSVVKKPKIQSDESGEKGVKVPRWPAPKIEPFTLHDYQKTKEELPKTVFIFDDKKESLLRNRRTPFRRNRKLATKVEPFSFDKRDQEILQRKMDRAKAVEHAAHLCQSKRRRSKSQGYENCKNTDPLVHHARVPKVLHKPPFVPQKSLHKATKPVEFHLNTLKRAREREAFDLHLRQKDEERRIMLQKLHETKRLEEEQEIAKLRKELVHKAHPVPVFQPFKVQPSDAPLTEPLSPTFMHGPKKRPVVNSDFADDPMEG